MVETKSQRHISQSMISLGKEGEVLDLIADSVMGLWDMVNNLTRLRPTQRERYRVTIFGSARIPEDHWVYAAVRDVAEELTRMGCDIITGGGPGLMRAANEGTKRADSTAHDRSVGIRVQLPFEQDVNAFVTQAYEHRTFFTRLQQFVLMSDAFVVVPGGIGTVLETMMIWQLLQVGHLQNTPLILAGKMYAELVAWCRRPHAQTGTPVGSPRGHSSPDMRGGWTRDIADPARTPRRLGCRQEAEDRNEIVRQWRRRPTDQGFDLRNSLVSNFMLGHGATTPQDYPQ